MGGRGLQVERSLRNDLETLVAASPEVYAPYYRTWCCRAPCAASGCGLA